ncbi:MAG: hypothetical protein K2X11_07030 [Acetobacteraceae bacterium]|nr:hypothetical protein [Acetobacteraceae bacterium]
MGLFDQIASALRRILGGDAAPAAPPPERSLALVPGNAIGETRIPRTWLVKDMDGTLEIRSPDDEIWVWFAIIPPGRLRDFLAEQDEWFRGEGVVPNGPPLERTAERDGLQVTRRSIPGSWNANATLVEYVIHAVPGAADAHRQLVVTIWSSDDDDSEHASGLARMLDGIRVSLT